MDDKAISRHGTLSANKKNGQSLKESRATVPASAHSGAIFQIAFEIRGRRGSDCGMTSPNLSFPLTDATFHRLENGLEVIVKETPGTELVSVQAWVRTGSLYEAAVLAVSAFRQHHCELGEQSKLEVEIRSSVTHTVTLKKIHSWLQGGAKSPKEAITKERLRALQ